MSAELVDPLIELTQRTPLGDVHLRYACRLALRNQLRNEATFRKLTESLRPKDTQLVAGICLSLKTRAAGDFLAQHIHELHVSNPTELAEYVAFAARYVSPDNVANLVAYAQRQYAGDVRAQQGFLESVHAGLQQRGGELPPDVRDWAISLATELLAADAGESPLAWSYVPHPSAPNLGNPWTISRRRQSADGVQETPLFSSFPHGEQRTGIYRSQPFWLLGEFSCYVAGHDGLPGKPPQGKNFVRLRDADTHSIIKQWSPPRNDVAQRVAWTSDRAEPRRVYLELVDGDTAGAFAWLAVGRFSEPRLNPSRLVESRRQAATLVAKFHLNDLRQALADLVDDPTTDIESRETIARALVAMAPDARLAALAEVISLTAAAPDIPQRASAAIVKRDFASSQEIIFEALQAATADEQLRVARPLSTSSEGIEILLTLVDSGRIAARCLIRPGVQQGLAVAASLEQQARIATLTARLPSEHEQLTAQIERLKARYSAAGGSVDVGQEVFRKNCNACHQVRGLGQQVGPNLDGIGNRGLDRLAEDVLAPSRNVDIAFRSTTVVTQEGQVYTGLLRPVEGAQLVLIDSKGQEVLIPTSAVEGQLPSALSPMPANFADVLPDQELNDLMSYLLSLRDS